jgi:hypothetical protein
MGRQDKCPQCGGACAGYIQGMNGVWYSTCSVCYNYFPVRGDPRYEEYELPPCSKCGHRTKVRL